MKSQGKQAPAVPPAGAGLGLTEATLCASTDFITNREQRQLVGMGELLRLHDDLIHLENYCRSVRLRLEALAWRA